MVWSDCDALQMFILHIYKGTQVFMVCMHFITEYLG